MIDQKIFNKEFGDWLGINQDQSVTTTERRVKYKKIKVAMPHCPVCDEELSGNNSFASPYRCSCGVWGSNWDNPSLFKVGKEDNL